MKEPGPGGKSYVLRTTAEDVVGSWRTQGLSHLAKYLSKVAESSMPGETEAGKLLAET
jgi:hypothetical protein